MSLEWIWLGALGAVLLPAIGHLYHFVLAVNVSSSFGCAKEPWTASGPACSSRFWYRRRSCSGAISRTPGGPGAGRHAPMRCCASSPEAPCCRSIRSCWRCASDPRGSSATRNGSILPRVATPCAHRNRRKSLGAEIPRQRGVPRSDCANGSWLIPAFPRASKD